MAFKPLPGESCALKVAPGQSGDEELQVSWSAPLFFGLGSRQYPPGCSLSPGNPKRKGSLPNGPLPGAHNRDSFRSDRYGCNPAVYGEGAVIRYSGTLQQTDQEAAVWNRNGLPEYLLGQQV